MRQLGSASLISSLFFYSVCRPGERRRKRKTKITMKIKIKIKRIKIKNP